MKKVFISYDIEDDIYRKKLSSHLLTLVRNKAISIWSEDDVIAGQVSEQEVSKNIRDADIIILIVSAKFIESKYDEILVAIERAKSKDIILLPVIARPCNLWKTSLETFSALPAGGVPISKWDDPDEAYTNIVEGVLKILYPEDRTRLQVSRVAKDEGKLKSATSETVKDYSGTAKKNADSGVGKTSRGSKNNKSSGHTPQTIFGSWKLVGANQNNQNIPFPGHEVSRFYPDYTFQLYRNNILLNYGTFGYKGDVLNLNSFTGEVVIRNFYCDGKKMTLEMKSMNSFWFYEKMNS